MYLSTRRLSILFLSLLATAVIARSQGTSSDPLERTTDLLNSDEIIMIWSQGPDDNTQSCYQKIYDLDPLQPNVNQRIVPKPLQTDQRIAGNKKLAVASGNFLGGSYKHLVAAWATLNDSIKIAVPNISAGTLSWSSTNRVTLRGPLMSSSASSNSGIRLATGNFFGDKRDEFILGYEGSDSTIHLQLYSFNTGSLVPVAGGSINDSRIVAPGTSNDNWAIASGDFNGDGDDEIVLAWIKPGTGANWTVSAKVYDVNASGNFVPKGSASVFTKPSFNVYNANIGVATGDFNNDAVKDEIALAFNWFQPSQSGPDSYLYMLSVKDSLNTVVWNNGRSANLDVVGDNNQEPMSIAAGDLNRDGRDDVVLGIGPAFYIYTCNDTLRPTQRLSQSISQPTDGSLYKYGDSYLAVSDMDRDRLPEIVVARNWFVRDPSTTQYFAMNVYHFVDTSFTTLLLYASRTNEEPQVTTGNEGMIRHYAMAMGDFNGDRVRVGNAVHYRKSSVQQPTVILNTPPVHFDVFEPDTTHFDLSGCYPGLGCGFSSTYIQSVTTDTTITTEIHNDWGVDASLSAGGNVLGIGVQAKLKASYGEGFGKVQGTNRSLTITTGRVSSGDDWIFATVVDYDFYEYPVYDSIGTTPVGYVLAAIANNPRPLWIEAKDDNIIGNVYKPNHEVGNVLSYETANSPDMAQSIVQFSDQTIGGTGSSFVEVNMSRFRENSADTSKNIGLEVGGSISGWGIELEANAQYNQSQVSTQTTKIGQSITLRGDFGHISPEFGTTGTYYITPYAYWSKYGALVLDYKVPTLPTGPNSFWLTRYGSRSDLTFNLPWRLDPEKGIPLPGGDLGYRQRTRDVFISHVDPRPGDTVTIGARVRNLGLQAVGTNVTVRFFNGDPAASGVQIGQATITGGIPARGTKYAFVPWTVAPATPRSARMYAVVDPDNAITNEVHENNNKGWAPLSDFAAPTSVHDVETKPTGFALYQSYPNPFNPSTTITYDVPARSHVTLRVYNMLGQEVTTLVDRMEEAGKKSVRFHAIGMASGVYYYRLETGSFVGIRKMVLMK